MSTPVVIPNFNDTTPAAPSGNTNVKWQSDALNPSDISAYMLTPYDLGFQLPGIPLANATYLIWEFPRTVVFPANFSGSQGKCLNNPTSTATFTIKKNGSNAGTAAISTGGVFTFTTTGGTTLTFNSGDYMTIVTPTVQDITLTDVGWVMAGTR